MRDVLLPNGYVELKTPLMFNKALWETSGHWQHYRQNMFLIENDEEQMAMKAMNCPGHMLVFASETRSYRDLPLRFHEQTPLHRNEASGVLSGLTRVRQFSQDDAHCFVMESQIGEEVERLLRLVQRVYGDFGLEYSVKLSTRPAEFLGEIATWDHAEAELKRALESAGQAYTVDEGDGAFYGPKIDFDVTDAIGRKWQCATIQLDYQMPQRFDLKYTGADNAEHRPVVIHRAIFGSFERFMALLIEHYAGAFPLWLAPVQAAVLPIVGSPPATPPRRSSATLEAGGLRVTVDARVEKIGYKIREAQLQQMPYMLVLGDREAAEGTVSVRSRRGGDLGAAARRGLPRRCPAGSSSRRGGSYRIRQRQAAAPGRSGADQRPNSRSRSARHRRNRRPAGHHGPAGRHSHRALQGTRSRGGLGHGRASGVSHHRLRPLPVQRAEAGPSGAEAPEDHRGQRDQVPARRSTSTTTTSRRSTSSASWPKATRSRRRCSSAAVKSRIPEIGRRILERLIQEVSELAIAENMPRLEGNTMHTILGPKPQLAQQRRERLAASGGAARPEVNMASLNDTASDRAPDTEAPDASQTARGDERGIANGRPTGTSGLVRPDKAGGERKRTCRS